MKRILLASTALVIAGHAAMAAPPPRYSWTGCYIGGHAGFGWSRNDVSEPAGSGGPFFAAPGTVIGVDSGNGTVFGGQAGCDMQFAQNWLVGVGGDYSWADIHGDTLDPFFNAKNGSNILVKAHADWLASVTGRVGFAWDRFMIYGKGGAAWTRQSYGLENLTFFGPGAADFCVPPSGGGAIACNPSGSDNRSGWVAGVGIEAVIQGNWTVAFEYAHYDFGTHSVALTDPNGASGSLSRTANVKTEIDTARFALNYRFGLPLRR